MGYRIRQIREKKGITRDELAELSGISSENIVALENGITETTTTKTLVKIANALETTIEEIFFCLMCLID